MRMVTVYALCDPRDGRKEVYVGASLKPLRRLSQHLSESKYGHNRKQLWISELLSAGLKPTLLILGEVAEGYARQAERDVIELFHLTRGNFLLNNLGIDGGWWAGNTVELLLDDAHQVTLVPEDMAMLMAYVLELETKLARSNG